LAIALVATACKVDTTVSIKVHDDGSGMVTVTAVLDPDAVKAAEAGGGKLEDRVRLADLTKAGWTVQPWTRAADGSAQIVLAKPFTSPEQVAGIMQEVSGKVGPLRDVSVTRDHGLLSTKYEAQGTVDLAQLQTGLTTDAAVVAALTNQQVDVNAIDQSLLQQLRDSVTVQVVVNLPGGTTTITGVPGQRVEIDASSTVRDTRRIALLLVAVVLLVFAAVVWFGGRHSRYRHRARQPIPRFDPHGRRG
jgi:hypothetical protein